MVKYSDLPSGNSRSNRNKRDNNTIFEESSEMDDINIYRDQGENNQLLDSFESSGIEYDKLKQLSQTSLDAMPTKTITEQMEDNRLNSSDDDTPESEIDRNIHGAITEGNSSNSHTLSGSTTEEHILNNDTDLESQRLPKHLTTKQRIVNVLHNLIPIKQTYERISNGLTTGRMQSNTPGRFIGQGTDGVFRNLMAKPDTESNRQEQENNPPSYEEAAADATPEYWESTVISPIYEDEVFVEGLPVGNIANFVWNALVTVAFQFVGFILCYLLHTSHAAKQGSRAGLGITLIFYGYGMVPSNFGHADKVPDRYEPSDPNSFDIDKSSSINGKVDTYNSGLFQQHSASSASAQSVKAPYFAYGIIAFGLFIILKSFVDYYRVKQMERVILSPPSSNTTFTTSTTSTTENTEEV